MSKTLGRRCTNAIQLFCVYRTALVLKKRNESGFRPLLCTYRINWARKTRNIFVSFKPPLPGNEPRTLAWKAAVLNTTLGPPSSPCLALLCKAKNQYLLTYNDFWLSTPFLCPQVYKICCGTGGKLYKYFIMSGVYFTKVFFQLQMIEKSKQTIQQTRASPLGTHICGVLAYWWYKRLLLFDFSG